MTRAPDQPAPPARKSDAMLRIQVGGTGLVLVALLVGLSTLLTSESRSGDAAASPASPAAAGAAAPGMPANDEALTDLGVQPAANDVAPPPVPTPPATQAPAPVGPIVPDLQPDPQLEGAVARR